MKMAEAVKIILKRKGHQVITTAVIDAAKNSFTNKNGISFKQGFLHLKDNALTTLLLIKELPSRIQLGFQFFLQDYTTELIKLITPQERAKFAMKTIACLTKMIVSGIYDVGINNLNLLPNRALSPVSKLVLARMVFKSLQGVMVQLIDEISQQIDSPSDRELLNKYKELLLDDKKNAIDKVFDEVMDLTDPSYLIVEKFKNYIFTGER